MCCENVDWIYLAEDRVHWETRVIGLEVRGNVMRCYAAAFKQNAFAVWNSYSVSSICRLLEISVTHRLSKSEYPGWTTQRKLSHCRPTYRVYIEYGFIICRSHSYKLCII